MSTNVIYVFKGDGWFFKQFAAFLLDGRDDMRIENIIESIVREIYKGKAVNGADHYVSVSSAQLMSQIDILYTSLFSRNDTPRSAIEEFQSPSKWSIILSHLWNKVFDSLWKISYATDRFPYETERRNELLPVAIRELDPTDTQLLRSRIITIFKEKMNSGEIGSATRATTIVENYNANAIQASSNRIQELEQQLGSVISDQLSSNMADFEIARYQNFVQEENKRLQNAMSIINRARVNLNEENQWLRRDFYMLMRFAWALKFIKEQLSTCMHMVGMKDQISDQHGLYTDVVEMVMSLTQATIDCNLNLTHSQIMHRQEMSMHVNVPALPNENNLQEVSEFGSDYEIENASEDDTLSNDESLRAIGDGTTDWQNYQLEMMSRALQLTDSRNPVLNANELAVTSKHPNKLKKKEIQKRFEEKSKQQKMAQQRSRDSRFQVELAKRKRQGEQPDDGIEVKTYRVEEDFIDDDFYDAE